ncbi:MAG: hypothetical protein ACREUA_10075 [Burkholderiales bacterium]
MIWIGRRRLHVAHAILAVLLFSQVSMAVEACTLPSNQPGIAFLDVPPCHQSGNKNACLAHCVAAYQALDSHHDVSPPQKADLELVFPPQPASLILPPYPVARLSRSVAPPAFISFCSLTT